MASGSGSRVVGLRRFLESKEPERRTAEAYRQLVRNHYDGPAGWFTSVTGVFTGHEALAGRLIGPRGFDIRGCKRILDAGCGNGRYLKLLLKRADPDAVLTGCDLSAAMLRRARRRLRSERPLLVTADLTRLPYRDQLFDAVVCGWVLEHLPDPILGLRELARVLRPGGKLLLLTTERTIPGAVCSRFYHCRTIRRAEVRSAAESSDLIWHREHWWSSIHKFAKLGGIVVEFRRADPTAPGEVLPRFNDTGFLPPGIHDAPLAEIARRFGRLSLLRRYQFESLARLSELARRSGVERLLVAGSFVTAKPEPADVNCVLQVGPHYPRNHAAAIELQRGLPFVEMTFVTPDLYDRLNAKILATDCRGELQGLVEIML